MAKKKSTNEVDQSARFIETARAAGTSEDEAVFDANLKKIAKAMPRQAKVAEAVVTKAKPK